MEFVVWLLYGLDELVRFTKETEQFWQPTGEEGLRGAKVHERVDVWLSHMANKDGRCPADTALGRLVGLIKDSLVVGVRSLEEENSAPPAPPTARTSSWSRIQRCISRKKMRGSGAGGISNETATVSGLTTPYRSSSAEAAKRLREITDELKKSEIESKGEGNRGEMNGPPPPPRPDPTGKKATKKGR